MDESLPIVSVITPTYNSSAYIRETIQCVKNQTYTNWEMIIVDDCSTDHTRDILQEEAKLDERIKVHFLKENSGAAVARNTALEHAKGTFIAFLDSDDLWFPEKLHTQVHFMLEHDYAFTFTKYELMDEAGKPLGKVVDIPDKIDYHGLLKNTIIGCLTVMINREKTGPFKMPNIRTRQDFALWLSILKKGYVAYGLKEVLSKYRVVSGSISSNKWKAAKRTWQVYRQIEQIDLFRASWYFMHYAYYAVKKRL